MSVYLFTALFYLLLFLLMCGTLLCVHVCAGGKESSTNKKIDDFFDKPKISDAKEPKGTPVAEEIGVNDYHSLALVSTNKVLVALAGVNRTSKDGKNITVLSKYIVIEDGNNLEDKLFPTDAGNGEWKKQFAVYDNCQSEDCVGTNVVRGLAAAVKGDKIYLLLANVSIKAQSTESCDGFNWCFWLVEGDATNTNQEDKPIVWKEEEKLKLTDVEQHNDIFKKELSEINLYDSSAFVIKKEKIVFIVKSQFKDKVDTAQTIKKVAAVFLLDETEGKNLKLVHHESSNDCCSTFFQWGEKIFKISTDNSKSSSKNKMMVLDADSSFKEIKSSSIFRVRGFLKGKENFVTATIGQKGTVLLFTQQKVAGSDGAGKKTVYLWMTDGTQVSFAGTIAEDIDCTNTFYGSFLYTKTKLFALHQTVETPGKGDNKIKFTLLKEQLDNITNTLDAWTKSTNEIKELYTNTATPITDINFTDGIVGFLSGANHEKTQWTDKYLNTNANIHGNSATQDGNGFKFTGDNAGAQWRVGKTAEDDQPYNFIDPGFTLLATVTVGSSTSPNGNSILGVGLAGGTKISLWCTANGKWGVKKSGQEEITASEINCTRDERYYVALVLDIGKKVFIYVDGQQLPKSGGIPIGQSTNIDYFYFGADSGPQNANTDVTITNVLLYNRPFTREKIQQLKSEKKKVNTQALSEGDGNKTPAHEDTTEETSGPETDNSPATSATPTTTEKDGTETNLRLFSMNNVAVLSLLFCPFTLLGRYVY